MRADESGHAEGEPADGGLLSEMELAVLYALATGASATEIASSLGPHASLMPADVERLAAELMARGLLQRDAASEGTRYLPTASGRRVMLGQLATWLAAAETLADERLQVERLRTDLLSTISHELRTPLTLIRTSIGLLLDSDPDAEMQQRLLRNIRQSTERMHLLVTDLLDLARLRSDRLELQVRSVDVGELIAGVVTLLRPLLDEKGQQVDVSLPTPAPVVPGDYRRLERVVLNLLANANTFAGPDATIGVAVTETGSAVTIAVRDTGPGIPEEAMPHLFEQFFTARTSSSRHNIGAGLGLPIAKGIVEAHGGRIWVESVLGAGTTVSFSLPSRSPREDLDESPGG